MLRPPAMANAPSAMNSLLCMRRLTRENSCSDSAMRVPNDPSRTGSGLNSADFDVGVGGQRGVQRVLPGGVEIVDQQAHANATRGGVAQFAQEQRAGGVAGEVVGLHVQRTLGAADQRDAAGQRLVAIGNQAQAGLLGVGGRHRGGGGLGQRRLLVDQRLRGRAPHVGRAARHSPPSA